MRPRTGWLLTALCLLAAARPAAAQTFYTFTGAGGGSPLFDPIDWSNPFNWQGTAVPPSSANTGIVIGGTPAGVSNNNLGTFTLTDLQFNVGTTLAGSTLDFRSSLGPSLIFLNTASAVAINNGSLIADAADVGVAFSSTTGQVTLAGQVSGSGGLRIGSGGPGTVILTNGNNAYSGTTTIYGGTLRTDALGALPQGGNVVVIAGTLNLNGHDQAIGSLTLSDPSTTASSGNASINLKGAFLILGGNVTYNPSSTSFGAIVNDNGQGRIDLGGATRTFTVGVGSDDARNGSDLSLNTGIGGTGGLIKAGSGILAAWSGAWTYTGATQITGGTISLNQANQLPATTAVFLSNGATLNLGPPPQALLGGSPTFFNQTIGSLAGSSGTTVNLLGAALTVGGDNTSTTFAGKLTGAGGALLKVGSGTLTLSGTGDDYSGGTTVTGGTLVATSDAALGTGPVTLGPLGTLVTNGSTGRTFTLNGGTLASGSSVTLNGSTVTGGFLAGGTFGTALSGPGTTLADMTIRSSVTLNLNSIGTGNADALINVTNNGQIGAAGAQVPIPFIGVTNGAAGRLNVGGKVNVTDFVSYGVLNVGTSATLTNVGASDLVLGGGSVTSIGVYNPSTGQVTPGGTLALGSTNLVVRGSFLRNNGAITGTGNLVIDYGGLVKGGGDYGLLHVQKVNGGTLLAGNSPGLVRFAFTTLDNGGPTGGDFSNATGTAGPPLGSTGSQLSGWSVFEYGDAGNTGGSAEVRATPANKAVWTFRTVQDSGDYSTPGTPANFNPAQGYVWPIVRPRSNATAADPANVTPVNTVAQIDIFDTGTNATVPLTVANLNNYLRFDPGQFQGQQGAFAFTLLPDALGDPNRVIAVTYTPVPEPGYALAVCVAALLASRFRRGKTGGG